MEKLDAKNPAISNLKALLYLRQKDFKTAAKYYEKASVTINEKKEVILVRGVVDGVMAYEIQTWRSDEDAFYGEATDFEGIVGHIHIDRISGAMISITYSPNKKNKKTLLEFYYDCNKATKKF